MGIKDFTMDQHKINPNKNKTKWLFIFFPLKRIKILSGSSISIKEINMTGFDCVLSVSWKKDKKLWHR